MSEVKQNLLYTKGDEWILIEGDIAQIGITDFAQDALNDIVYLELPESGDTFELDAEFGVVESVKAASDLYAPFDLEVLASNESLVEEPEKINEDPYGSWMIRVKITNSDQLADLMSPAAYEEYCKDR